MTINAHEGKPFERLIPPHIDSNNIVHMDPKRIGKRDEEGEPAEHAGGVGLGSN